MATPNPKFNGLTDDQVLSILEKIASQLDVAASICRNEGLRLQETQELTSMYAFYALDSMLTGMGALADMASGAGVVGDVPTWFCGPNFHPRSLSTQGQAERGAA